MIFFNVSLKPGSMCIQITPSSSGLYRWLIFVGHHFQAQLFMGFQDLIEMTEMGFGLE